MEFARTTTTKKAISMEKLPQNTSLVKEMLKLFMACREAFSQERVFLRGVMLAVGELLTTGTHHVTEVLRALQLSKEDWTAWYRLLSKPGRFKEAEAGRVLVQQTLAMQSSEQPYIVGIDCTGVPRTSYQVEGSGWAKCPRNPAWKVGIHRAQRFLNLSYLAQLEEGYSRAIPLRFLTAFPEKAVRKVTAATLEQEAGVAALTWVRGELGEDGPALLALADGSYDKPDFWLNLPSKTHALVRTAKNRVLKYLPPVHTGRGRPRKYGERAPAPQDYLQERAGWQHMQVPVRGHKRRMLARVEGPFVREKMSSFPLLLLCVRGQSWKQAGRNKRREPVFYLVNAVLRDGTWQLPYPLEMLLTWAWQRWELEVVHREVKSGFGLGDKQCFSPSAAVTSVQWSAWVYSLLSLAAYRVYGAAYCPKRHTAWERRPRRLTLRFLLDTVRLELATSPLFAWLSPAAPTNWPKLEANLIPLLHAPSPYPLFDFK
jgi:hypothetical protein